MNNFSKETILIFFKTQWKYIIPGVMITLVLLLLIIFATKKNKTPSTPTANIRINGVIPAGIITPTKKPFSLIGLFGGSEKKSATVLNTKTTDKKLKNIPSGDLSAAIPSVITRVASSGSKSTQALSAGSSVQTSQGTIDPIANIQTGVDSNKQPDNISVIFKNPDGTTTTYIPAGTPPGDIRWGRYTNNKSKYAINYPINWQFTYTLDEFGFEGIALYPPGADLNDKNGPHIGFGMSETFLLPSALSTAGTPYTTPIKSDGITGNLYTNGPLGNSYIASTFKYNGYYFGLGSTKSDPLFAYIYYYMIYSLTFTP